VCSHAKLYASHKPFSIESHAHAEHGTVLQHTFRLPTIRVFDFTSHASVKSSNRYETFLKNVGYLVDAIVDGSNKYVTPHKHGLRESKMKVEESYMSGNLEKCEEFKKYDPQIIPEIPLYKEVCSFYRINTICEHFIR